MYVCIIYTYIYRSLSLSLSLRRLGTRSKRVETDLGQMEKTRSGIILSSEWLGIMKPIGRLRQRLCSHARSGIGPVGWPIAVSFDCNFGRFLFSIGLARRFDAY